MTDEVRREKRLPPVKGIAGQEKNEQHWRRNVMGWKRNGLGRKMNGLGWGKKVLREEKEVGTQTSEGCCRMQTPLQLPHTLHRPYTNVGSPPRRS